MIQVALDHTEAAAKNLRTFWFRPERPVNYIAGQFTEIYLPHDNPDNRGIKRWFTLSSSPTDGLVSITTRLDPVRPSSFKQTLFALKPGAKLRLADPMGDFVLPKKKDIPIVFVAGGIGVTPMHSMIKWLVDTREQRNIHLFYAVHTLDEVAFRDLFEKAPIQFDMILAEPPADWEGMTGRLTTDVIWDLPGVQDHALIYLSGPEPMVEAFYKELKSKGVPEHRLVTDYFPGYTEENI
jgi:glycine betaine catabolism B